MQVRLLGVTQEPDTKVYKYYRVRVLCIDTEYTPLRLNEINMITGMYILMTSI